jgi:tRNA modification GTPase
MLNDNSTICAISTPSGVGAISIIRISGKDSFAILKKIIKTKENFDTVSHAKMFHASIYDNDDVLDYVLITKFYAPKSYTGENIAEIYCHGSEYIQSRLIEILCENGIHIAGPGEFSKRALLNNKMNLLQTEAVADMIAVKSKESHKLALNQIKGNVYKEINKLREKLIELYSLLELELDFGEEDVEFVKREDLIFSIDNLNQQIDKLTYSFRYGNAVKSGVPVVIVGKPNVGKSSLLNNILQEDRAIVSEIPGTTRDSIEDEIILEGIRFRFIDTAGLRESDDEVEIIGIDRTYKKLEKAMIILLMIDINEEEKLKNEIVCHLKDYLTDNQFLLLVINKIDTVSEFELSDFYLDIPQIAVSAKSNYNVDLLQKNLVSTVKSLQSENQNIIISSAFHFQCLKKSQAYLYKAKENIENNVSSDFVAQDIREAIHYIGEITGHISNEEILGEIFSKFCIGK